MRASHPFSSHRLAEALCFSDEGRFLAELTKEVIDDLESKRYQHVEWRISVYGTKSDEWKKLAAWVVDNNLVSKKVRWVIQVPR